MDINLKPCPRCGGEAEIRYACKAIVGVSETGGYQPYCTDCLIAPPYAFYTKQDAADWWNDRKLEEENKALKSFMEQIHDAFSFKGDNKDRTDKEILDDVAYVLRYYNDVFKEEK